MLKSNLESALELTEKGINFSIAHNNIRFLPSLLMRKFELLCMTNKMGEAEEVHNTILELLKLVNMDGKYERQKKKMEKIHLNYFGESKNRT